MGSPESKTSQSAKLSCDLNLPVFTEPMREHWPSAVSWADAMTWFDSLRAGLAEPYASPEERLRDKNPIPFRLD